MKRSRTEKQVMEKLGQTAAAVTQSRCSACLDLGPWTQTFFSGLLETPGRHAPYLPGGSRQISLQCKPVWCIYCTWHCSFSKIARPDPLSLRLVSGRWGLYLQHLCPLSPARGGCLHSPACPLGVHGFGAPRVLVELCPIPLPSLLVNRKAP